MNGKGAVEMRAAPRNPKLVYAEINATLAARCTDLVHHPRNCSYQPVKKSNKKENLIEQREVRFSTICSSFLQDGWMDG